jgi:PAS domain S-box-containing protein
MRPDSAFSKKDEDKTRGELVNELEALRNHYSRLKAIVQRYEQVMGKKNVCNGLYDFEAEKDCIEALCDELRSPEEVARSREAQLDEETSRKVATVVETERKRLFDVLENLPAMICLLTPDYRVVFANRAFREKFGESKGRNCYDYCYGRTQPCDFCESYKVLETCKPHRWEVTGPDGSVIDVYNVPFTDVDGKPMVLEMDIDITERKRAEEKLRVSERRFRGIYEQAPLGIALIDSFTGQFLQINQKYCDIVGRTMDDMLTRNWQSITYPDDIQEDLDNMARLIGGEITDYKMEKRYIHANGSIIWVGLTVVRLWDADPEYKCHIAMVEDITERKRAEDTNKRFATMVETSIDGITFQDFDGNILEWNHGAEKIYGYSKAEALKSGISMIIPSDRIEEKKALVNELKNGVDTKSIETKRITKDGRVLDIWLTLTALKDDSGKPYGFTTIERDITERQRAEREINEAKTQAELYLDLMGHDIRNMNQVSMGFLEIALESTNIDKKDKELLLKSMGGLENSTRLIDNVRKLQMAQTRELKLHAVDACQAILRVLGHYSNMPNVNATFNYELPPGCSVMANDLLYEVFENLVGNALKHAGRKPTISIKYETDMLNGTDYNKFIVEDDGPGIPDKLKLNIFTHRVHSGAKTRGSGLGLYIVKSLVDSYGGQVFVEDRVPGDYKQGARFVVMLPTIV